MTQDSQVAAELARLRAELHAHSAMVVKLVDDHERRIRELEAAQLQAKGAYRFFMLLATLPAGLVYWLLRGGK